MELAILAHHGGILFSLDAEELLGRLEGLCAEAPADLRLASETARDREAMRARLARLRSSADARRAYVELMRDVWAAVRPDWVRNGRRSVEAAVAARREIQHHGAPWEEIARSNYRPGGRVLDDLVASLPRDGVVAVVPAYFAHLGSLVDLPGTVMIGVRAEGSGAEARARTENLARRLKTISDPTRLAIVEVLRATPSTVGELAEIFSLAQPTVSNHVKILRDAGFVANASRGGRRELVLEHGTLDELLDHLEGMLDPARQSAPRARRPGPPRSAPEGDQPTLGRPPGAAHGSRPGRAANRSRRCHDRAMSTSPTRLQPHHALTIIVAAVVAIVVAYVLLGWLAGVILFLIKTVVVLALIALTVYLVLRWAARSR